MSAIQIDFDRDRLRPLLDSGASMFQLVSYEWERVDDNREQMKKPITDIADKQRKAIKQWESAHPGWSTTDKGKDEWTELVQNVMDTVDDRTPGENRIIKGVAKEVKINSKD